MKAYSGIFYGTRVPCIFFFFLSLIAPYSIFYKSSFTFMKNKEKKGFRPLTNELELGLGRNLEERRSFDEKEGFGLREKREVSRCLSLNKTRLTLEYI